MVRTRSDRRAEQRAMCRFLESDLYQRTPLPEAKGAVGMLWTSPLGWQVLFGIPSACYPDDPDFNDRQEIDLWILDPDGDLFRHLPDASVAELERMLP